MGGVPAKEIRKRFTEKQIEEISNLKIYDMDIHSLQAILREKYSK